MRAQSPHEGLMELHFVFGNFRGGGEQILCGGARCRPRLVRALCRTLPAHDPVAQKDRAAVSLIPISDFPPMSMRLT